MTRKAPPPPRFEESLQRLEAIVDELEQPGASLDRALELFEEGITHLRAASEALARADASVKVLVSQAGGMLELRELDGS